MGYPIYQTPAEHLAKAKQHLPRIVTLCGSTRFKSEMAEVNAAYTLDGCIVLAPGVFGHSDGHVSDEDKERLDELHLRKIDLADTVVVVDPGGYIGESTRREIAYARTARKTVVYTAVPSLPGFVEHYGIPVADMGEDGGLIALGHHTPAPALGAFNRHARKVWGFRAATHRAALYDGAIQDGPAGDVRERWAVHLYECGDCQGDPECSTCPEIKRAWAGGGWWIDYNAKQGDPGAFPITTWRV